MLIHMKEMAALGIDVGDGLDVYGDFDDRIREKTNIENDEI